MDMTPVMRTTLPAPVARPRSYLFHLGALLILGVIDAGTLISLYADRYGRRFIVFLGGAIIMAMLILSVYSMHVAGTRAADLASTAVTDMDAALKLREQVTIFENLADRVRRGETGKMPVSAVQTYWSQLGSLPDPGYHSAGHREQLNLMRALRTLHDGLLVPLLETGLDQTTTAETFKQLEIANGNLRECIAALNTAKLKELLVELMLTKTEYDQTLRWILAGWSLLLGLILTLAIIWLSRTWLRGLGAEPETPVTP